MNFKIVCACLILIFVCCCVWKGILIVDDFHPSDKMLLEYDENYSYESFANDAIKQESNEDITPPNIIKKGYHIHINLDTLLMYVYKDAELIKTYPVSGGDPKTPSPEGTWKIISKAKWGEGFGGSWMGFNVPWGKYGIHGTKYPWFVGKQNSSHGCIRMKNENVKELYGIVPHGTIVTIVQKNKTFKVLKSGDVGSDVLKTQKALKNLGYFYDWPSGKFEDNLKKSVIKFQKANNCKTTGTVSRNLYDIIIKMHEKKLIKDEETKAEEEKKKRELELEGELQGELEEEFEGNLENQPL